MRETSQQNPEVHSALQEALDVASEEKLLHFEESPIPENTAKTHAVTPHLSSAAIGRSSGKSEAFSLATEHEQRSAGISFPEYPKDPTQAAAYARGIGAELGKLRKSDVALAA